MTADPHTTCEPDSHSFTKRWRREPVWMPLCSHLLPFLIWIFFILAIQLAQLFGAQCGGRVLSVTYAAKSLLCAIALLVLRPWRYYKAPAISVNSIIIGLIGGTAVALLWILPETQWMFVHCPAFTAAYNKWLIMPLGAYPDYFRPELFPAVPLSYPSLAYSPAVCGWPLTLAKLVGSAFVISVAEEYFFRGGLYRWLRNNNFLSVSLTKYDASAFWAVVAIFALEHDRWFMGMAAGLVYGWIVMRTGRVIPAVIAHATTNLLLGMYVIVSKQYGFW